ncbi:MAG: hypothetical protein L3K08_00400 [Thermoplasmata archaeon]|nr:hypothetical protein [Thermoplasmata archaeon]
MSAGGPASREPRPQAAPPVRPAPPPRPRAPSLPLASRAYLAPMLALVGLAVGLVAWAFAQAPLPPGVDPGHWLAASYPYAGLPTAPDPADQMFFYSPLLFPILGGLVRLTGSPPMAADLTAIGLFLAYGLSLILLARRFLFYGPFQVALVGLSMFSGATLQMLFWGGYPNLFGFVLMNVALVFLLRFVRTGRDRDAAGFYGFLLLTFLAHDLSFAILVAAVAGAAIFLLLFGKVRPAFLWRPANVVGAIGLVAGIAAYTVLTSRSGIAHPSYFSANPSAYAVDQVGEIFSPLAHGPVLFPAGPPVYLPPLPTAILLAAAPLVALVGLVLARDMAPSRVDTRLVLVAGWLSAALAVPGIGYLARVQTDYPRFLYFLPLPATLLALLVAERLLVPTLLAAAAPPPPVPAGSDGWVRRAPPSILGPLPFVTASVALVLVLMFPFVTVPTVLDNEAAGTAVAHDHEFLQAMGWLRASSTPGSVLTVPSAARWTEALSARDAYTIGPVWLLFDPFQITDAQESYWALTSTYMVTNDQVALGCSGFATPVLSEGPIFTAYDEAVPFPVLRILTGGLALNVTETGSTRTVSVVPVLAGIGPGPGAGAPLIFARYAASPAAVTESIYVRPDGTGHVLFRVTPGSGESVNALDITFAPPPSYSTTLATDALQSLAITSAPSPATVATRIAFSEPIVPEGPVNIAQPSWTVAVRDPNGSAPFSVDLAFSVPGSRGPTASLPAFFNTSEFLAGAGIHFLLWPAIGGAAAELAYFEASFGYRALDANDEWTLLQG